jgi:DNA-binding NarL/FixJ family response regulator
MAGRERELRSIRSLIQLAGRGRGGVLWIEGEPGIGKSTLLDAFEQECRAQGVRVLRGTARQMETGLPFAAVGSCLGLDDPDTSGPAARIGAALRGGEGPDTSLAAYRELAVVEMILDLLEDLCAAGPVALLLDDAQWADRQSLLALHRIGLAAGHQPLVLGLTTRSVPHNEDLAQLLDSLESQGWGGLRLGPLPTADVAELVEQLLGARPDRGLVELVGGAAGNPLYVTELVAALRREGRISTAGGVAHYDSHPDALDPDLVHSDQDHPDRVHLPESLAEAILRRLDFLPRSARSVLQVAAALGAGLNVSELAVILDKSPVELYGVIEEAVRAGVLTDSGGELVFRHDLIRQALSESLPVTVRDGLRIQAAHALADSGAAVDRVVRYLSHDAALDSRMLDWLTGSADALVVRAPQAGVDLLERSLARIESGDPRAVTLRRQLVRALLWVGTADRAEQAAHAALATLPPTDDRGDEVALRTMLVHACFQQGRLGRAIREAQEAMRLPGLTVPQAARFEFLAMQCRFTLGELDPAEEPDARRMMAVDDGVVQAYGLNYLACLRFVQGRYGEGIELIDRAQAAIADREALPEWTSGNALNRAFCLVELDRLAEATEAFESGTRLAEQYGSIYWSWYRLGTAGVHSLAGRWDDALAEIKAGLDTVDALGPMRVLDSGWGLRGQAALIAVHRGDLGNAAALLGGPGAIHRDAFYGYLRLWAEARVNEAEGRPLEALDLLFEAWVSADKLRRHRGLHYVVPDMARLAAALGDTQRAQQLAKDVEKLAGPDPVPSMRATASLCRALADNDPDMMLSAERDYATAGRPLYQAYAAENAAVLLARAGRTQEARAELAVAVDLYEGLEARWDMARAELRARQEGVRRTGHNPRRRPKSGWGALTETERKIASLVAEGNSNPAIAGRLFISRRTVQSHVSSILAKLDLTSRVELAVVAHQHAHD